MTMEDLLVLCILLMFVRDVVQPKKRVATNVNVILSLIIIPP